MSAVDPQIFIRKLIIQESTLAKNRGSQLKAIFLDQPVYAKVARAYGISPTTAPAGIQINGIKIAPFDVLAPA